jgi:hypothetical protein
MLARMWYLRVDDQLLLAGALRRLRVLVHTCDVVNFQSFAKRTAVIETSLKRTCGAEALLGACELLDGHLYSTVGHTINH